MLHRGRFIIAMATITIVCIIFPWSADAQLYPLFNPMPTTSFEFESPPDLLKHNMSENAGSLFMKGSTHLIDGELKRAEVAFKESLQLEPNQVASNLGLAEVAFRRGNLIEVEGHLQKARAVDQDNPIIERAMGRYLLSQGKVSEAEGNFKRAIDLNPKWAAPLVDLGNIYWQGQTQKAIDTYRTAIEIDPNFAGSHYALGTALASLGEYSQAQAALEEAVRLAPKNPIPLQALGQLYISRRRYDTALESFDAALKVKSDFFQAHLGRGEIFMIRGEDNKAITEYGAALKINPKTADAYVKLGMMHQRNNRLAKAKKAYLLAIKADAKQVIAYNNLAWIAAERKEGLDDALVWAQMAVELAPKNPNVYDTLGWLYRTRGELEKAFLALEKATTMKVDHNPNRAQFFYHLGIVYAQKGRTSDAIQALKNALALSENFSGADDARRQLSRLARN